MYATETHHAEKVLDAVLPADHESTKVMKPGKKPFHAPTFAVAAQWAPALDACATAATVGRDHLETITLGQTPIQSVAVVCLVADQAFGKEGEEAVPEDSLDELAFMRRSAFHANGERKTVAIGDSDDFRALATPCGPDRKAPFFAPEKEASMKASSSSSFPRARNFWDARAVSVPTCPLAHTVENADGRSGTAGISSTVPATGHRCPTGSKNGFLRPDFLKVRLGSQVFGVSGSYAKCGLA